MRVTRSKHFVESPLLGRRAYLDVFEFSADPEYLLLFFGGSGIDEGEYQRRGQSIIPIFDPLFAAVENCQLTFVHVCAPFDVPFARFADFPDQLARWNEHVRLEILERWRGLPFFVASFSGGAALGFSGVHEDQCSFGGAALGVDALPEQFSSPAHWDSRLRIYSARDDRVCHQPRNRETIDRLVCNGEADEISLRAGGHRLEDYSTLECLGALMGLRSGT